MAYIDVASIYVIRFIAEYDTVIRVGQYVTVSIQWPDFIRLVSTIVIWTSLAACKTVQIVELSQYLLCSHCKYFLRNLGVFRINHILMHMFVVPQHLVATIIIIERARDFWYKVKCFQKIS